MSLVGKKAPEFRAKAVVKDKIIEDFLCRIMRENTSYSFSIRSILPLFARRNFTPFKRSSKNLRNGALK